MLKTKAQLDFVRAAGQRYKYAMLIHEIESIKPKTPEQQRVATLQATAKKAQSAVKAERARQQAAKAQQSLMQASKVVTTV